MSIKQVVNLIDVAKKEGGEDFTLTRALDEDKKLCE